MREQSLTGASGALAFDGARLVLALETELAHEDGDTGDAVLSLVPVDEPVGIEIGTAEMELVDTYSCFR